MPNAKFSGEQNRRALASRLCESAATFVRFSFSWQYRTNNQRIPKLLKAARSAFSLPPLQTRDCCNVVYPKNFFISQNLPFCLHNYLFFINVCTFLRKAARSAFSLSRLSLLFLPKCFLLLSHIAL